MVAMRPGTNEEPDANQLPLFSPPSRPPTLRPASLTLQRPPRLIFFNGSGSNPIQTNRDRQPCNCKRDRMCRENLLDMWASGMRLHMLLPKGPSDLTGGGWSRGSGVHRYDPSLCSRDGLVMDSGGRLIRNLLLRVVVQGSRTILPNPGPWARHNASVTVRDGRRVECSATHERQAPGPLQTARLQVSTQLGGSALACGWQKVSSVRRSNAAGDGLERTSMGIFETHIRNQ